jgi:hypothetical protein
MIIKFIIIVFIIFVVTRVFSRYLKNDITFRELVLWLIFWALVTLAVLMPQKTDVVAQTLGVSRGADLLVYLSIIVLFFIVFKIIVKLEKIERNITEIVRQDALKKKDE